MLSFFLQEIRMWTGVYITKIKTWWSRRATEGRVGEAPLPFFENQNRCPDFGKKTFLDYGVFRRNNSKVFPRSLFFLFLKKCISKSANSTKLALPLKILVVRQWRYIASSFPEKGKSKLSNFYWENESHSALSKFYCFF